MIIPPPSPTKEKSSIDDVDDRLPKNFQSSVSNSPNIGTLTGLLPTGKLPLPTIPPEVEQGQREKWKELIEGAAGPNPSVTQRPSRPTNLAVPNKVEQERGAEIGAGIAIGVAMGLVSAYVAVRLCLNAKRKPKIPDLENNPLSQQEPRLVRRQI